MKYPGLKIVVLIFLWMLPAVVSAQFEFRSASILDIIKTLEDETDMRFLYRESQLAGIRVDLFSDSVNIFDDLRKELETYKLTLKIDLDRNQALIFKSRTADTRSSISISGQVVDAQTGERLPYATIHWDLNGKRSGTASNSSGVFRIASGLTADSFTVTASYLGYQSEEWTFDINSAKNYNDITLRLEPRAITNNEIIITGSSFSAFTDTSYQRFVNNGVLNPLGDNNTVKALQALPSVNTTTALNNGINVRGSSEDATVVLLDGITIYNQSHLFGLLDSFNSNALQTSGFYYDVTPAQFQATPGATLSLITRTGSLNKFSGNAGFSNTSGNITLEGPLKKGQSSWLISGRSSFLNQLDWFGSSDLIAYGLNVDRPQELLADNLTDLDSRLVIPGDSDALFYDIHAKSYFENDNGSRLIASIYAGGDQVNQDAERFVRRFNPDNPRQRFSLTPVSTNNEWGNYSGSLNYKTPSGARAYSNFMAGFSIYRSKFSKDDFVYNRIDAESPGSPQVFIYELRNESIFNELKADYSADLFFDNLQATLGSSYQYLSGEYYEESFDRPGLLTDYRAHLIDFYGQADLNQFENLSLNSGLRLHYFSNGNFLRLSPRIKLQLWPNRPVSLGAGYSRNYQFTHRLSFYNVSSPDIWVISSEDQPPTSVDYLTGGLYIRPFTGFLFQVEAYYKWIDNARLFDLNTQSLINSIESSPWLANYEGKNRGIEVMSRYDHRLFQWTNSYTWSRAEFTNPVINDASPVYEPGEYFYADWDRTHNYTGTLQIKVTRGLNAFGSLTLATGTPNRLYLVGYEAQERLDNYQRLDVGLEYKTGIGNQQIEFNASVYNVTDEKNPWYREINVVIDNSGTRSQLGAESVDIYDLGIQPSFNITVWF
ncbi:TonB-dependent receptor [Balneola sp. MJW-20]|uniref:TonB-dependent receptor n=1 Tax=Gracilimonas aurantiaca TaxID=3234185 RepID=UPI0034653FE5